ncbi:MAG: ComEC/Rec2 family competence protein [Proteobacteria bacterium]|nr:ComEC/Rec2 family competence protein [Pseudomonadota bacterium]MBI3496261.1 ComEC/Rec2 family competence protein [Pseudomonadota bacterium]
MVEVAVSGAGLEPERFWGASAVAGLLRHLAAEGERRALWAPVFFGAGIGLYFALPVEPPLWLGLAAAAGAIALAVALRRRPGWREAALALALSAGGFALASVNSWERSTPMLQRRMGPVPVTGRVIDIDTREKGWSVIIAPDPLPGLTAGEQPPRIRVHIPARSDELNPGDRIRLKAMLFPVPAQTLPEGRDLQREAYFARIGAVGYSFGGARHDLEEASGEVSLAEPAGGFQQWLIQLRTEMTRRIATVLPGSAGGVASALITGKRGAIAEEVKQAFRDSGLSHLLAIAGLHLGLVGGFVFFAVRALLALVPYVALRYSIKKIAAAVVLAVLVCYLMISGSSIPTQRAFVMNGLLFAAILVDRLRISMRVCAIAAFFVLAISPSSLVGVSYQMSFGAVVALIAVYESFGQRLGRMLHGGSVGGKVLGYVAGVVVTTIVATVGTDPYSIYHFHRLALYSPLANAVAVPLSAVWTLPWGVVACMLMPLGLEQWALVPMGWGIDVTIFVAQWVSALPGNVWLMPRLPAGGLLLISMGGLWLCLWNQAWRWWGVAPIVLGLFSMTLTRPPDIVIADGARMIAVRAADGRYLVNAAPGERLYQAALAEETGEALAPWPKPGEAQDSRLDCAGARCIYSAHGQRVAVVIGSDGLPRDCRGFDAIVSSVPAGFRCRSAVPIVDRFDSWRLGGVGLWLDRRGIVVESANESRGTRPWVPQRRRRPEIATEQAP